MAFYEVRIKQKREFSRVLNQEIWQNGKKTLRCHEESVSHLSALFSESNSGIAYLRL